MTGHARILDIYFEAEHYNHNCGCTIPEGWSASVEADMGHGYEQLPKHIGNSPQDIVDGLKADFRRVTASAQVHETVRVNTVV